jgi:bifunctional DNA-binding transcriptional regulator/antitoxin component of YhaV-PrlF toxin-antitoxin module
MNNSWEVILEEDEYGEIILPVPTEIIRKYDWQEGDNIEFEIMKDYVIITNTSAKEREANSTS